MNMSEIAGLTHSAPAKRVLLAEPRGFCAGVDRAVRCVEVLLSAASTASTANEANAVNAESMANAQNAPTRASHVGLGQSGLPPVYVRRHIVHNRHVVEGFERRGVVFVDELADIPQEAVDAGVPVVFSAHGVSPAVRDEAAARGLYVVDATCPLVSKVHREVSRYVKAGYDIIYIAHRGHDEATGVIGEAPEHVHLVEDADDVQALHFTKDDKLMCLSQTTLSVDETEGLRNLLGARFPWMKLPPTEDICYATQDRQIAVKQLAEIADGVIVIGSEHSSNTRQLVKVAQSVFDSADGGSESRCAYRIDGASELNVSWFEGIRTVGLSSGASAPDALIAEVLERLRDFGFDTVETVVAAQETMSFALPAELRSLRIT